MKKYFVAGTDEELQFGDTVEMTFTKKTKNGKVVENHLECEFLPELVELLLESEVIEERDCEDEQNPIDFSDGVYEGIEDIKDLMEEQAELLKGLTETVAELVKVLTKEKAAKTAKAK